MKGLRRQVAAGTRLYIKFTHASAGTQGIAMQFRDGSPRD